MVNSGYVWGGQRMRKKLTFYIINVFIVSIFYNEHVFLIIRKTKN